MAEITYQVPAGADDTYIEYGAWGGSATLVPSGSVLVFGRRAVGALNSTSLRFTSVTIPAGTYVTDARLRFVAGATETVSGCNVTVYADDSADPTAPTDVASFFGKTPTTNVVAWAAVPAWTAGSTYESPNLAHVVNELVRSYDYSGGRAMQFFIKEGSSPATAQRKGTSYESAANKAAVLVLKLAHEAGLSALGGLSGLSAMV